MNTSILKLKATVIRPKDDDELDGLAASISFPVECDWDTVLNIISDAAKAWNLNVEIWKFQQ